MKKSKEASLVLLCVWPTFFCSSFCQLRRLIIGKKGFYNNNSFIQVSRYLALQLMGNTGEMIM